MHLHVTMSRDAYLETRRAEGRDLALASGPESPDVTAPPGGGP
jgi:hypothetical protein